MKDRATGALATSENNKSSAKKVKDMSIDENQTKDIKAFSLRRFRVADGNKLITIDLVRKFFPIITLLILCTLFALRSPRFLSFNNLMIVAQQAAVLMTVAAGMTFVIIAGSIDLSVGSIAALTGLTAASLSDSMSVWALFPALVIGLCCGLFNGLLIAKCKIPSFIATLGGMVIFRGIVLYYTRGAPVRIDDEIFLHVFSARSFGVPHSAIITVIVAVIAVLFLDVAVIGREVKAIGGGERVAQLTGINIDRTKIFVFALTGILCGVAGVLQSARSMAATSQLGESLEMDAIASVVVGGTPLSGGIGAIHGTVLGVLIITILANGMNMMGVDPYIQNIVKGFVLIAAVFISLDRKKIGIIK